MSHAPAIYAVTELVIDFYTPTVSVRAVDVHRSMSLKARRLPMLARVVLEQP